MQGSYLATKVAPCRAGKTAKQNLLTCSFEPDLGRLLVDTGTRISTNPLTESPVEYEQPGLALLAAADLGAKVRKLSGSRQIVYDVILHALHAEI